MSMTPRTLAEANLPWLENAVASGRGDESAQMHVRMARIVCRGIQQLAEGTYAWLSEDLRVLGIEQGDLPEPIGLPDGMVLTPEESALALLDRFQTMSSVADSGLTIRQMRELCRALLQLVRGDYPYRLTAQAREMRASVAVARARAA